MCAELLFAMNITHVSNVFVLLKVLFLVETIKAYDQVRTSPLTDKMLLMNRARYMVQYRSTLGTNHTVWATVW
jgi:hypothetical protein